MSDDLATMLERLSALKPELALRFGVSAIHVFGSRARGEEGPDSDLDLRSTSLPAPGRPCSRWPGWVGLWSPLGVRVDVVARANLNPRLATHFQRDLVAA
ncbi:MAG TPA: nucleotidyltransferase domain-containing protein [Caulobacteraceae bacterium]|nr:nucleotidyltransferase domain-containing protein [Caulobacteraceae bacterium]